MSYLKLEEVKTQILTCSHPKVKKIWETGSFGKTEENTGVEMKINIIMIDNTRYHFSDDGDGSRLKKCEEWLSTIPIK